MLSSCGRPASRRVACRLLRSLSSKAAQGASEESNDGSKIFLAAGGLAFCGLLASYVSQYGASPKSAAAKGSETWLSNWCAERAQRPPWAPALTSCARRSNTHVVSTSHYHLPQSLEELEALVAAAHASRGKLRPVGSGLSPNGLGFCAGGMVNLALCDKVRRARYARACAARARLR